MRRLGPTLAALAAVSCGAPPGEGGRLGFNLLIDRAVSDRVASLQVSVLQQSKGPSCSQLQRDCLSNHASASQLLPLTDSAGKQHPALLFPLDLRDGGIQDLTVSGIPVGQNFLVVIEALTRDTPPNLYGSSCNVSREVSAGVNPVLIANRIAAPGGGTDGGFLAACDPRFEK